MEFILKNGLKGLFSKKYILSYAQSLDIIIDSKILNRYSKKSKNIIFEENLETNQKFGSISIVNGIGVSI